MSVAARIFSSTFVFDNHLSPDNYQSQQLLESLVSAGGFVVSCADPQGIVRQNRIFVKEVNKEGDIVGNVEINDSSIHKSLTSWNQRLESAIKCKLRRAGGCSHQKELMEESVGELLAIVRKTCKQEKAANSTCDALFNHAQSKGKSVEGMFQEQVASKLDQYSDEALKFMRGQLI
eukprot:TRINITY_DN4389_c0_g1_i1.p1 TRINITY_DN4389_c0_g1~~TRINITY_DN4389_c0_g1_i1.p1  ORF type:complete len:187 (-),score=19.30 TRINITY_DN4389_c0_g1_i1:343-870(-)